MLTFVLCFLGGLVLGYVFSELRGNKLRTDFLVLQEKLRMQEEAKELVKAELKQLTSEIFTEKSRTFREDSLRGMELMLNPFREKMTEFSRKVEEIHLTDTKDRIKLHAEITRIAEVSSRLGQEAENLSRALKGDVKMQGNWGEMILEKILESSGLRSGEEFVLQGKDMKLKDDEGRTQMPDVIIHLPETKHLIIDAKVSLVAYERFINNNNEEDLTLFLDSLYAHIKGLSSKKYQHLEKILSPDYVMLFVPLEGAFMLAMQKDKELFTFAWERNIVLVSPSTLLATLRTVASLWKQERQTKNALEIARQAGALYDKFVSVTEDLDGIQGQLRRVNDSVDTLKGKMISGKGSVAARMENLRDLGAKTSKQLQLETE
ncbi:MAG: DNA recombination protein RmuC [Bacteriovoracaceae bacterium]